jgi:hypothetical protein
MRPHAKLDVYTFLLLQLDEHSKQVLGAWIDARSEHSLQAYGEELIHVSSPRMQVWFFETSLRAVQFVQVQAKKCTIRARIRLLLMYTFIPRLQD